MGDCRPRRDGVAGPCEEGVVLREHPVDLAVELNDAKSGVGRVCRYQTGEGRGGGYLRGGRGRERGSAPPSAINRAAAEGGRERATAAHFLIQERNPQRCPPKWLQHRQRRDCLHARESVEFLVCCKNRTGLTFSVLPLMPTRVPRREYSSEDAGRATESSEYGAPSTSKRTSAPAGQRRRKQASLYSLAQPVRHSPAGNGPAPLSLGIAWVCSDRSMGPSMDDIDGVALMCRLRRRGGLAVRQTTRDDAASRELGRRAAMLMFCEARPRP